MTPNSRTKLFLNLREHLKAANLQFFERAAERQFLMMMRAEEMTFSQLVTVRADGVTIRIETKLPTIVPPHRRVAAAELVARLNRLTDRGHYDLDVDGGEISFRVDAHALGSVLMPGLLVRLLSMALQPAVRDIPVFDAVLLRDADPAESIKQNAERIARATEAAERAARSTKNPIRRVRSKERRKVLEDFLEGIGGSIDRARAPKAPDDAPKAADAGGAGDAAKPADGPAPDEQAPKQEP
jgi:hypothetical protein